ncbi:hypothetical protein L6R29_18920, partial [Myxococcota bacterium]|nr:hypothetical protein [Myxococcota bacterium]
MHSYLLHSKDYDALLLAYLDALDHSDFDQVSIILRLAEHDPQLDEALREAHQALYSDEIIKKIQTDALSTKPFPTKQHTPPPLPFE